MLGDILNGVNNRYSLLHNGQIRKLLKTTTTTTTHSNLFIVYTSEERPAIILTSCLLSCYNSFLLLLPKIKLDYAGGKIFLKKLYLLTQFCFHRVLGIHWKATSYDSYSFPCWCEVACL